MASEYEIIAAQCSFTRISKHTSTNSWAWCANSTAPEQQTQQKARMFSKFSTSMKVKRLLCPIQKATLEHITCQNLICCYIALLLNNPIHETLPHHRYTHNWLWA